MQHIRRCFADGPKTNQADLAVCQFLQASGSHVAHLNLHLAAIPHSPVTGNHIFDYTEHQKKRLLCHCLRVHARAVADINSPLSGRCQINLIECNAL